MYEYVPGILVAGTGKTERGWSQRLDAVWSGGSLGICKAHPTKGAVCLET